VYSIRMSTRFKPVGTNKKINKFHNYLSAKQHILKVTFCQIILAIFMGNKEQTPYNTSIQIKPFVRIITF